MTSVAVSQQEGHASEPVADDQSSAEQPAHANTDAHADTTTHAAHGEAAHGEEHAKEEFKIGEMIMHHISDAHQIHLGGSLYIPLPIIILNNGQLEIFSSSNFYTVNEHGELDFHNYKGYRNHHEMIEIAGENDSYGYKVMDFSITKSVFGMMLVIVLMIILFRSIANKYKRNVGKAPSGFQNMIEPFILFVRDDIALPSLGKKKAALYTPFLLTVFFFIWMCNILGLIPFLGGFNITGTLSITLVLAAIVFIITSVSGNKHYWGHIFWPPGVPGFVKVILVPIEFMSIFIKPCVLMIRLTANITAGHIIILAFVGLALMFGQQSPAAGYGVGVGSVLFMAFMYCLEMLVAFLQAYVFTLLAALYFGDATQDHHHEHEHDHEIQHAH
jgi:F-type H+-transporting ATPase subunit a